jgi:N-glycosylase/DNA lyase
MTERSDGMAIPSTDLLAAEILSAAIEDGRDRKRRLRKRLAEWQKVQQEYGRVPAHIDLFLWRARANHAKAVEKCRLLHAVLPANTSIREIEPNGGNQ